MWIRSQNKISLLNANEITIESNNDKSIIYGSHSSISNGDGEFYLGAYTTKERAIEILDMIQNYLTNGIVYQEDNWTSYSVFEMPKE